MDYQATNRTAAMFLNVTLVVLEIYALFTAIRQDGVATLVTYPVLVNLFALIVSAFFMYSTALKIRELNTLQRREKPHTIKGAGSKEEAARRYDKIITSEEERSSKIRVLRFIATVLLLTCLISSLLLKTSIFSAAGGLGHPIFHGPFKFFYFICPVLSVLSFVFLEPGEPLTEKELKAAVIPTPIFIIAVILLSIFIKNFPGPSVLTGSGFFLLKLICFVGSILFPLLFSYLIRKLNAEKAE